MKFVYLSSLFMACALSAGAQGIYQFEDPGFENSWKYANRPGYGWYSFKDADGDAADTGNFFGVPCPQHVTENGNSYVKLVSKKVMGISNANGNMTTGRVHMGAAVADSPLNYNYSDIDNADGIGYMKFAGIPDKITFSAKFKAGGSNSSNAGRIQLFLHDGEISEFKDPVPDNEKDEQNKHQIAYASKLIPTKTEWKDYEEEFTYTYNGKIPENHYLLASITTNPTPGESNGDELCIDDIYFVYYSDLSSLTYGNTTITSFPADGKIDFSKEPYSPEKLSYILHGKGAIAELGEYNKENGTIELTVKGNDFGHEVDPSNPNITTYTLQFAPAVSEVVGDYESLVSVELIGNTTPSKNTISITDDNGKAAFTMKNFEFAGNSVGDVTLSNTVLSYSNDGSINITADEQPLTLSMKMEGQEIPLYTKVTLTEGKISKIGDKKVLNATVNIKWYLTDAYDEATATNITATITAMPFTTTISEDGKTLTVTGDVAADLASLVVPTDADVNAIDLTGANLEKVMATSAFGVKNSNTLFYVDAEETNLTGDNVVKGTECENLVLTDGLTFNAPEGFAAANVTFNRKFTAGQLSTVVLPFSFETANVNGTVYKLESVENRVLSFKSVEGTADANVPYLVKTESDNLFKTLTDVTVAKTPETVEKSIAGGVTHVGNFGKTMDIASDGQTSWYGYTSEGKFVKVLSGTIKPFRTAINSTSATTQNSFALKLDGTVTGILNLENPNAKVDVYTISGVCVRKNVPAASALNGLSRGVYIVGGQKVVK